MAYNQKHKNGVIFNAHFNHQAHASSALAVQERVCGSCRPRLARRGTWSTRDAAQMANFLPNMAFWVVTGLASHIRRQPLRQPHFGNRVQFSDFVSVL